MSLIDRLADGASQVLEIKRVFDAPRGLVFKAWTEEKRLGQWWGPEGFVVPFLEFDMRPGGTWRACLRAPDGTNHWQHGVCHQVVPPEFLVYSFIWDDDPLHEMIVSVQFVERGPKTELIFGQRMFKSAEQRDSHKDGWSSSFNRLTAYLALMTPDFYAHQGPMTSSGAHDLTDLPTDVESLARIIEGLVIHEYMAPAYGVTVSPERASESHIRHVDEMLDRIFAIDASPLTVARPPEKRLVGVCHHFSLLFVAMLRAHGFPARYRQGFGTYFNRPYVEEHVVGEYWNAQQSRWILVDPQLDEVWRGKLAFDFDPLDVPHDRFIIAGDAWQQCRAGKADPAHYGIFRGNLRGLWFIAGEVIRDVSALNAVELLPWDVWGAMPQPGQPLDARFPYFDQLATLTLSDALDELRSRFESDAGLRVPPIVFNAVLNRPEPWQRPSQVSGSV